MKQNFKVGDKVWAVMVTDWSYNAHCLKCEIEEIRPKQHTVLLRHSEIGSVYGNFTNIFVKKSDAQVLVKKVNKIVKQIKKLEKELGTISLAEI